MGDTIEDMDVEEEPEDNRRELLEKKITIL